MSHATADMTWARMGRVSGGGREFENSREFSSSYELVRVGRAQVGIQDKFGKAANTKTSNKKKSKESREAIRTKR